MKELGNRLSEKAAYFILLYNSVLYESIEKGR
jgi:hypothetical protein